MGAHYFEDVTVESVLAAYKRMGYPLFTKGDYNLNLFGIRTNDDESNLFNDVIGVLYKIDGEWTLYKVHATTDPGTYWRKNPMNVKGTAILKEGFHSKAFKMGRHQQKYPALVQNAPLPLYRDNNKDNKLDRDEKNLYRETAGINLHRATNIYNQHSIVVDKWSAGCQVVAGYDDFGKLMQIINKSASIFGHIFSYTLFNEEQFFGE